jgi:quercetin dioxygenase-like cupin family protein
MTIRNKFVFATLALLAASTNADEILRSSQSWDGGSIEYPTGVSEVTAVKLEIGRGETTPFHCHPVPTLGYILSGSVEVETKSGKKTILHQGEPVIEVMRTLHRGKALGGPVEILVFYAGVVDLPNTILASDDPDLEHCTR